MAEKYLRCNLCFKMYPHTDLTRCDCGGTLSKRYRTLKAKLSEEYPQLKVIEFLMKKNAKKTNQEIYWQCNDCKDELPPDSDNKWLTCTKCKGPLYLRSRNVELLPGESFMEKGTRMHKEFAAKLEKKKYDSIKIGDEIKFEVRTGPSKRSHLRKVLDKFVTGHDRKFYFLVVQFAKKSGYPVLVEDVVEIIPQEE